MFQQNEKVVYPGHGVALVNRVIQKNIGGSVTSFYELKFLNKDMVILVPTGNALAIGIREVALSDTIDTILELLAKPARKITSQDLSATSWSKRNKDYQNKIRTGKLEDISAIYRDLKHIELQKELSYGEKTMLNKTESLLAQELAIVQDMGEDKALENIRSVFKGAHLTSMKQSSL